MMPQTAHTTLWTLDRTTPDPTVVRVRRLLLIVALLVLLGTSVVAGWSSARPRAQTPLPMAAERPVPRLESEGLAALLIAGDAALGSAGVNPLAASRVLAYAAAAYLDATSSEKTLVALNPGRVDRRAAQAAGVAVFDALVETPWLDGVARTWAGELPQPPVALVDEILVRARADGFEESAGKAAPKWSSPWPVAVPALEPDWGALTTLVSRSCTVDPPAPSRSTELVSATRALTDLLTSSNPYEQVALLRNIRPLADPAGFTLVTGPMSWLMPVFSSADDPTAGAYAISVFDVGVLSQRAAYADPERGPFDQLLWDLRTEPPEEVMTTLRSWPYLSPLPVPAYPSLIAATVTVGSSLLGEYPDAGFSIPGLLEPVQIADRSEVDQALVPWGRGVFFLDSDIRAGTELGDCVAREVRERVS